MSINRKKFLFGSWKFGFWFIEKLVWNKKDKKLCFQTAQDSSLRAEHSTQEWRAGSLFLLYLARRTRVRHPRGSPSDRRILRGALTIINFPINPNLSLIKYFLHISNICDIITLETKGREILLWLFAKAVYILTTMKNTRTMFAQ